MFEILVNPCFMVVYYKIIELFMKLVISLIICKNKKLSDEKVKYITLMFYKTKS